MLEPHIKLDSTFFRSTAVVPIRVAGRIVLWRWEAQVSDDRFDYGYTWTRLGALRKAKRCTSRLMETDDSRRP